MGLKSKIVVLVTGCIVIFALSALRSAESSTTEKPDSISRQVKEIFARLDKLAVERKQRSREYLFSLPDENLADVYARANAPQQISPADIGSLSKNALEAIKKDRSKIIEELLKRSSPLDEKEDKSFRSDNQKLIDELATLGPAAVPAISSQMGGDYQRTGHWALTIDALVKMGEDAVEPLIPLMDSQDAYLRGNVAYVLSRSADARSTNVLLSALEDEDGNVRHHAINGLIGLGPKIVGSEKLITLLINHLQDRNCLYESIQGLEQYGDERAIEPLGIIERFYVLRGKADLRYAARQAINTILRRAGKPVNEVSREDYPDKPPAYDQLLAAAQCPNAAIRCTAISQLDLYKNEQTARFLTGRIKEECNNYMVLDSIVWALYGIMHPSGRQDKSNISGQLMQEAFDAFLSIPETNQELSANILRACKVSARIDDFISPNQYKVLSAAITGASSVLNTASETKVRLDRIERLKDIIRGWCLESRDQNLRRVCCSTISTVARVPPETAETWSAEQQDELMEQLMPLLNSPNPEIRLIECLGYIGDRRIVSQLIELLQHQDSNVRRFAAGALGQIGDPQSLPTLKNLAETDPYQYENGVYGVREAASAAIEKIKKQGPQK